MSNIKITLRNKTDFEVIFLIGEKSFTLSSNQSTIITAEKKRSIEARPRFLGVSSSFIVGGLKSDTILDCFMCKDENNTKPFTLSLVTAKH